MSDPTESQVLTAEREAARGLRDVEDMGGYVRVNGVRYDDVPSWDEL